MSKISNFFENAVKNHPNKSAIAVSGLLLTGIIFSNPPLNRDLILDTSIEQDGERIYFVANQDAGYGNYYDGSFISSEKQCKDIPRCQSFGGFFEEQRAYLKDKYNVLVLPDDWEDNGKDYYSFRSALRMADVKGRNLYAQLEVDSSNILLRKEAFEHGVYYRDLLVVASTSEFVIDEIESSNILSPEHKECLKLVQSENSYYGHDFVTISGVDCPTLNIPSPSN